MKEKSGSMYRVVNVLITLFCVISWLSLTVVYQNGAKIYNKNIKAIEALNRINLETRTIDQNALMAFIGKDSDERVSVYIENIKNSIENTKNAMSTYESFSNVLSDMETERYNQCRLNLNTYISIIEQLLDEFNNGNYLEAQTIYLQEFKSIKESTYELLNATVDLSETNAEKSVAHTKNIYTILCIGFIVFVIVGNVIVVIAEKHSQKQEEDIAEKESKLKEANKKVKQTNKNIESITYKDVLTGLPNRYALEERISKHIKNPESPSMDIAVIDIDDFKHINDAYGYEIGDRYLGEIVKRIKTPFNNLCDMYRVTGNEFCIIFKEGTPPNTVTTALNDMRAIVRETVVIEQYTLKRTLTASVMHWTQQNTNSKKVLLCMLDSALHRAKEDGKDRIITVQESSSI